ncbi:MAG: 9-O-acetylesterase [Pirellulales bacterium]|nr:9-O-acetylesterase [Pirellulales bacterium]
MVGLSVLFCAAFAQAELRLPAVLGDNMVLQRDQPLPLWGWAEPGDTVTVRIAGQTLTAQADAEGRWKTTAAPLPAGGPHEIKIESSSGDRLTLRNVLVGEVWICSGQSNMYWPLEWSHQAQQEIAAANHPRIRLFKVANVMAMEPQSDCQGRWRACRPATVPDFTAIGYFFGRQLERELKVPVGLIQTAWGGTPAEFWTRREILGADPALQGLLQDQHAAQLYNGMVAPLIPFAIRGAIWYQGESNSPRAYQYRTLFPAMICNWRKDWSQGDFPFGFVQIAPFRYERQDPVCSAELREAQLMTLQKVPNTGMAVTMDIGNPQDIHPKNKQDVGRRLALWALAKVYGKDGVYSGPIYKSMAVEGDKVRLTFDHVGGGLVSRDGKPLTEFTIAGADQKFVPATAEIDGPNVVVSSPEVPHPVAVRFAWRDDSVPNLSNRDGLPASSFRTDDWKGVTQTE